MYIEDFVYKGITNINVFKIEYFTQFTHFKTSLNVPRVLAANKQTKKKFRLHSLLEVLGDVWISRRQNLRHPYWFPLSASLFYFVFSWFPHLLIGLFTLPT